MKDKRITISDIAKKSGYSKTSVSFAFNCPERISATAVEKILETAKNLDYIPDPIARNFSLGQHFSLGFLAPQSLDITILNPHVVEVLRGIGTVCEKNGYTLTLIPPLHSSIAEAIKNATVDGIIGMGLEFKSDIREALKKRKLPLVCLDAIEEDDTYSISIDNIEAAFTQMSKVLERGHRDIAIISLPEAAYIETKDAISPGVAQYRSMGYKKAIESCSAQVKTSQVAETATFRGGKSAAKEILSKASPSCIVTMSDIQALGVIEELKERKIRVPDDISVVGFDGSVKEYPLSFSLATIDQNGYKKGEKAAEVLFNILKGKEPSENKILMPFSFIDGGSLKSI